MPEHETHQQKQPENPPIAHRWFYLTALLVLLLACMPLATPPLNGDPVLMTQSVATAPAEPSGTPAVLPPEPLPTDTAAVVALPPASPTPVVPVTLVLVGNHYDRQALSLLGGYREGAWLGPEQAAPYIEINAEYRTFVLDGLEQVTRLSAIEASNAPAEGCNQPHYVLRTEGDLLPYSVGLNAGWPAYPRPVEWLSSQNEFYLQAVRETLQAAGLPDPDVRIQQVLRADLDGDGADEVLIAASRFLEPTGHDVSPGDYSIVLLRSFVAGQISTQRVVGEVYTSARSLAFPPSYTVQGVLDANADGRLEVLVYRQVWEGQGSQLFEMRSGQLQEALRLQCGL